MEGPRWFKGWSRKYVLLLNLQDFQDAVLWQLQTYSTYDSYEQSLVCALVCVHNTDRECIYSGTRAQQLLWITLTTTKLQRQSHVYIIDMQLHLYYMHTLFLLQCNMHTLFLLKSKVQKNCTLNSEFYFLYFMQPPTPDLWGIPAVIVFCKKLTQ